MAKLYAKKPVAAPKMNPKKETVSLLLHYSKALTVLKVGKMKIEHIAN